MKPIGYARSREYWVRFGWGTLMGLLGGLAAFIYVVLVEKLINPLVWPGQMPIEPFSGPFRIVIITTLAGLVVGLIHKTMPTEEVDVFAAIPKGNMDTTHAVGAVLASIVSAVGCMMAAVPCALAPFPLTLAMIVLLITGTPVMVTGDISAV